MILSLTIYRDRKTMNNADTKTSLNIRLLLIVRSKYSTFNSDYSGAANTHTKTKTYIATTTKTKTKTNTQTNNNTKTKSKTNTKT